MALSAYFNFQSDHDIAYEDEIARNPYYLSTWLNYLKSKTNGKPIVRYFIYERALGYLPRSYKLWNGYLTELKNQLLHKLITDNRYQFLINVFERALAHLHKMPLIWLAAAFICYFFIHTYSYLI